MLRYAGAGRQQVVKEKDAEVRAERTVPDPGVAMTAYGAVVEIGFEESTDMLIPSRWQTAAGSRTARNGRSRRYGRRGFPEPAAGPRTDLVQVTLRQQIFLLEPFIGQVSRRPRRWA
jgi:hypothetical protein